MTVATLNPFDLLNEDAVPKTSVKKTVVESKPVVASKEVKPTKDIKDTSKPTNTRNAKNNTSAEINANVSEKTPLRRNNNNRRSNASEGNERQERRRTDRHSRTGYKQDGEKRLTSGKGSWGKAVEQGEEGVTVDESVAIAEAVEGIEINGEAGDAAAENAEPTVAHLTLAQYQASLKKPVVASTATRKVTTTLAKDQIVKKETEVFVFPEIVKKTTSAKKSNDTVKSSGIDVTKYISVKAVSSVEPRAERTDRPPRTNNADNRRNHEGRRNSNNNNGNKRESYTPKPTKMNLNDDRSFPAVGSR